MGLQDVARPLRTYLFKNYGWRGLQKIELDGVCEGKSVSFFTHIAILCMCVNPCLGMQSGRCGTGAAFRLIPIMEGMNALTSLPLPVQTIGLLVLSNLFMTFAWYGHLKSLATVPWYVAALISWGIALFEYLLQVPANRIGFQQAGFSVGQLKIMQEVITLTVFVPFAMFYLKEPFKLDYVWAGLCMVGAVYFIFRSG
jgi:uncharacterized protein (DUF486 family)